MNVTIFGMGAGGRALAVLCAQRGLRVHACERFDALRADVAEAGGMLRYSGALGDGEVAVDLIDDPTSAAAAAPLVLVATTAQGQSWAVDAVRAAGVPEQTLVMLSGLMGSALSARRGAARASCIGETSVFPLSARMVDGRCHIRRSFRPLAAAVPSADGRRLVDRIAGIIDARPGSSIVESCLSNPNPLIHAGTMLLNLAHVEREGFDARVALEGITPKSLRLIDALDAERLAIGAAYGYRLPPVDDLYQELSGRPPAFRAPGKAPAQPLQARFIDEDVPYGIALWVSLAHAAQVEVPTMTAVWHLHATVDPTLATRARTVATLGLPNRAAGVLAAVEGGVR